MTDQPTPPRSEALDEGAARLETFGDDVTDVQSRFIVVHQLRASADIQDSETKRETGWATTSDRARLMRKAADTIERLASRTPTPSQPVTDARDAEITRLRMALGITRERIKDWPIGDQETCMCGSSVASHNIDSGHAPVSQGDYAVDQLIQSITDALDFPAQTPR